MSGTRVRIPPTPPNAKKHTFSCVFCIFTTKFDEEFERADRRHKKNSKNIAVVVNSIVCCHTAPACRKAKALVRGNPAHSGGEETPEQPGGEITPETPEDEPTGLSGGAIAGIVIGCILGALIIAYGICAFLYKKKILKGAFFAKIYPFIKD